jgi:hypothetical protein
MQRFSGFTKWEQELAEMFEDDFARLREASGAIADKRKAMKWGEKVYGAMDYIETAVSEMAEPEISEARGASVCLDWRLKCPTKENGIAEWFKFSCFARPFAVLQST